MQPERCPKDPKCIAWIPTVEAILTKDQAEFGPGDFRCVHDSRCPVFDAEHGDAPVVRTSIWSCLDPGDPDCPSWFSGRED